MKHIIRFDYGRSHAWWVRVERPGFVKRKLFSDSTFGGKKRALLAAQKYRDSLMKFAPQRRKREFELDPGTCKRTLRAVYTQKYKPYAVDSWVAWIRIAPGRLASTNWSIEKWGVAEAKRRTLQWLESARKQQRQNYRRIRKQG